jgi:hypothetical protein
LKSDKLLRRIHSRILKKKKHKDLEDYKKQINGCELNLNVANKGHKTGDGKAMILGISIFSYNFYRANEM